MSSSRPNLAPLRDRRFRALFLGSTTSRLGNAIAPVALAFGVLDFSHSVTTLGLVVGARTLANVALVLFGGVLADRISRSVLLVGSSFVAGVAQVGTALALLCHADSVALIAVLAVLNGASSAVALPASTALIPQLVERDSLLGANAVFRLGSNLSAVVGYSVAGLLVATAGAGVGIAVDALSFFVAAAYFRTIASEATTTSRSHSIARQLADGWREFASRPWLWIVVLSFTVVNAVGPGAINVLGPVWADGAIGRSTWGVALAFQTVGLVAGGLVSLRLRFRRLLFYGMAWVLPSSIPLFLMSANAAAPWLCVGFFLAGLGTEQFGVAWETTLHQQIPSDVLARVSSYDLFGSLVAIPVGQLAAGPVSTSAGLDPTLLGCAIALVAAVVATLLSPAVWRLTQRVAAVT